MYDLLPQLSRALTPLQYCYIYEIFYGLTGIGLKVALGIFYLRIAVERWQINVIRFILFGTVIFGSGCIFLVIFQCVPGTSSHSSATLPSFNADLCAVHTFWTIYPANDHCIPITPQNAITFTLNSMNAVADWILGTVPFFMVRGLNLSFATKMAVAGILAFAAVYVKAIHSPDNMSSHHARGSTGTIVRMKYVEDLTNGPEFLCKLDP